jgi:predicted phosphoribosyltransferase
LRRHEACLADRLSVRPAFDVVTVVPSGERARDDAHPLRRIVGEVVEPTRNRYEHLLRRSEIALTPRVVQTSRYETVTALHGESVLLIDDTWTTGASAQSAAGALKAGGAGIVAVVIVGRHVHEDFEDNAARLAALPREFTWDRCALEND